MLVNMEQLPAISHVGADGALAELIYDPIAKTTSFAVRDGAGAVQLQPALDLSQGERLIPYAPTNHLIASGLVRFASAVGAAQPKAELLAQIRAYLDRYVDLSPAFADIAPYYVLLSWVYDAFNELPYLRFRGSFGTGKTRALLTVGAICYKPFFASGASSVSPIFHILDAVGGTLVLDEADFRFSDATAELTKILNNGNMKGWPVLRTMRNRHREFSPRAFKVFGPKLIAMRESFADHALESRFLTEETGGRALRPEIPLYLPDALEADALGLRNRLLRWRLDHRDAIRPDTTRLIAGVEPRLNQTALALLSLVDEPQIRDRIIANLMAVDRAGKDARLQSAEGRVVAAIVEAFAGRSTPYVSVAEITRRLNLQHERDRLAALSNKSVGSIIRSRLRIATRKSRGVYIIPQSELPRIGVLASRYGLAL